MLANCILGCMLYLTRGDSMVDINAKFQEMYKHQQQEKSRRQKEIEKYAHNVEDFMNIVSIEKTGLCSEFVASYYAKKHQEFGDAEFNKIKNQAQGYIRHLEVSGQISEHINWFKFVLEKVGGGFERS